MKQRCENAMGPRFRDYGGRGIVVCEQWRASFAAFLVDMGRRPSPDHSLDRIDNNGNYEPGNCRWATRVEQARNRSNARLLTLDGTTLNLAVWAEMQGIQEATIRARITRRGWSVSDALTKTAVANSKKTTCPKGHPYTLRPNGNRKCLTCDRVRQQFARARSAAENTSPRCA